MKFVLRIGDMHCNVIYCYDTPLYTPYITAKANTRILHTSTTAIYYSTVTLVHPMSPKDIWKSVTVRRMKGLDFRSKNKKECLYITVAVLRQKLRPT